MYVLKMCVTEMVAVVSIVDVGVDTGVDGVDDVIFSGKCPDPMATSDIIPLICLRAAACALRSSEKKSNFFT